MEALNYIGYKKLENILVIVNDNEMSIGENVGFISKFLKRVITSGKYLNFREDVKSFINRVKADRVKKTLERLERSIKGYVTPFYALESLGFRFFNVCEGNNIEKLLPMLKKIKDLKGPIVLLVKTEKGKGYCFAEENKEKFHGIAPFDIKTGNTHKSSVSYSEVFGNKILELGKEDKDIYTLSAAMIKGTGLHKFLEEFPERCIDTGIAEGFAVTLAGGLAKSRKKPYVCIYSTFIQRAVSQLIHDISLQNLPVRFIIDRSGIVGEDGKTHNGIYDLSFFLSIQNFTVLCPTTSKELEQALDISKNFNLGPLVIRIPRDSIFDIEDEKPLEIGRWKEIKKGSKNLFIATGTMLKIILEIYDELKNRGIDCTIVSAASVKPLDENYLLNYIKGYDNIFVLEENYVRNSFGTSILEFLNDNGIQKIIHRIALKSAIIPHGKREELLKEEKLKGESLIERIEELIYGRKNSKSKKFIDCLLNFQDVKDLELCDDQGVKVSTHTYDVLNISINKIKEKYIKLEEAQKKVDFFAITVGIIMHDISKSSIKRNEENLSHSQMMIQNPEYIISEVYEVLNLIEKQLGYTLIKEVRENIAHIVQSHHGKWGKVQPETEEANIVYIADMESAKYHRINPIQANDILKYSVKGLGLTEIEKKLNCTAAVIKDRIRRAKES